MRIPRIDARLALAGALALAACSGGKGQESAGQESAADGIGEGVAECRQYEAGLDRCYHRSTAFASQPNVIPKSRDDRERIRRLCTHALHDLTLVCGPLAAADPPP